MLLTVVAEAVLFRSQPLDALRPRNGRGALVASAALWALANLGSRS